MKKQSKMSMNFWSKILLIYSSNPDANAWDSSKTVRKRNNLCQHFRNNCAKNSALFPKSVYVWILDCTRLRFPFRKNVNITASSKVPDQRFVFLWAFSMERTNSFLLIDYFSIFSIWERLWMIWLPTISVTWFSTRMN